ncbi:ATP-dependent RNA helicase HrpA [Thermostilla marina]
MLADRFRLRRDLDRIRQEQAAGKPVEAKLSAWQTRLEASIERCRTRKSRVPAVGFDPALPITERLDEIAAAIQDNPVVIVCGETGSGKSTQLPKLCLQLGRGVAGMIGHTQPRRIAARSVAARVAEELGVPLGREVGYKVRFADATDPDTLIKLMTDGMLLAETQTDRFLEQYDTIIVDEAHERSLNIDFLLGYLHRLLQKRRDLKVIITSATIDAARFAKHFRTPAGDAPVIEVAGRMYPVEVRYRPPIAEDGADEVDWQQGVLDAVDELMGEARGDILVFMPTERHIHETAKLLRAKANAGDAALRRCELLPLYARLPAKEQQRIFQPHNKRRIVIATNVAESSLTVPGIRCVIDSGTARISRYAPRTKTQRLPIEPISQASAEQRKGRCGREGPGICIRLYAEEDLLQRDRFTPPEIQRTNLAAVILRLKALRLGEIEGFPFLDPPRRDAVRDGLKTLFELGAIDEKHRLTEVGRRLAELPVDPRIGKMILTAVEEGCLTEILIIAAALECEDPRRRPIEQAAEADNAHALFQHPESDFFGFLKLWDFYHDLKSKLSRSRLRKACAQHFLSYNRMREWAELYLELRRLVVAQGWKPGKRRDDYTAVHRAVLSGLLSNTAFRKTKHEYVVAGGNKCVLWPGSALFAEKPAWIVAAEVLETGRRYLRTCARIDPEWVEDLAPHLVKKQYVDPYWSAKRGAAMAYEKVLLFGLPVVPRRRVPYGPVDPAAARAMLIQHGLIEGQTRLRAAFLRHNRALREAMESAQIKLRRADLLLGEWAQFDFYDARIPHHVYDVNTLVKWLRKAERKDRRVLFMSESDFVRERLPSSLPDDFPDTMPLDDAALPLEYTFAPGDVRDGVTLTVPVEALGSIDPQRLEWLVPGLFEEKVTALIRSLPKNLRRLLIPAAETARTVAQTIRFGEGRMLPAVASVLSRIAGRPVSVDDFDMSKVPPELVMNLRVVDRSGNVLAEGRDWEDLRRRMGVEHRGCGTVADPRWNRDAITDWDFGELPESITVSRGGIRITAYPMLVDCGNSVALRLADQPHRAESETRFALRRLFAMKFRGPLRTQLEWFPDRQKLAMQATVIPDFDLQEELELLVADRACWAEAAIPRSEEEYRRLLAEGKKRLPVAVQEVVAVVRPLLEQCYQAHLAVEKTQSTQWEDVVTDIRRQMDRLLRPHFLTATPWRWLRCFPRYFQAICLRLEALHSGNLFRDREAMETIRRYEEMYDRRKRLHDEMDIVDPELEHFRWMIEEFRVSMFAQRLGTEVTVSTKRLDRQWEKVRR